MTKQTREAIDRAFHYLEQESQAALLPEQEIALLHHRRWWGSLISRAESRKSVAMKLLSLLQDRGTSGIDAARCWLMDMQMDSKTTLVLQVGITRQLTTLMRYHEQLASRPPDDSFEAHALANLAYLLVAADVLAVHLPQPELGL